MGDKADKVIPIRLTSTQVDELDALAARIPGAKRSALARDLIQLALDEARKDPGRLIRPAAPVKP